MAVYYHHYYYSRSYYNLLPTVTTIIHEWNTVHDTVLEMNLNNKLEVLFVRFGSLFMNEVQYIFTTSGLKIYSDWSFLSSRMDVTRVRGSVGCYHVKYRSLQTLTMFNDIEPCLERRIFSSFLWGKTHNIIVSTKWIQRQKTVTLDCNYVNIYMFICIYTRFI